MRRRKYCGLAALLCGVMLISGCGSTLPEMTDEQYKQTVEYAAGLLMRYSNNGQERLIYVDAKELKKQREKEAKQSSAAASASSTAPKQTPTPAPAPEPEPVATTQEDNFNPEVLPEETPEEVTAVAAAEEVSEAATEETTEETTEEVTQETTAVSDPSAVTLSHEQSQEIGDNIFLSYQGYMVSRTYPESSKSYVVNADKGKKLLVLRFDLYNASDSSKTINMIPLKLLFEIILNGQNLGYSSVTFLPNDLASYSGTIDSRAHESVVVLTQIDEKMSGHIDSLGMIVSQNGQKQTVNLE